MKRILVPTSGASTWRQFLADPEIQWVRKASALELAVSWERAERTKRGLPAEIASALDKEPLLAGASLIMAIPEHRVRLKGRGYASQNDVWALLTSSNGYVSLTVEGKAGEPFASTLADWLKEASDGKKVRLNFLCHTLQISPSPPTGLRYQLFHRTASAVLEAQRVKAPLAVVIVQSFRTNEEAWADYSAFARLLGANPVRGGVAKASRTGAEQLFIGWVDSACASDSDITDFGVGSRA